MHQNNVNAARRVVLGAIAFLFTSAAHAGLTDLVNRLTGTGQPTQLKVVLVDITSSINAADWALYERTWASLISANRPGDRVVLATISATPVSQFIALADRSISCTTRRLEDAAALKRVNAALMSDFSMIRAGNFQPAKATNLLDSISATDALFAQGRRGGQQMTLLVLSDMIEESLAANFAKRPPDGTTTQALLARRKAQGLLPDLSGVRVAVVGASGKSGQQMVAIQRFWHEYFKHTGASVETYGRHALVPQDLRR